MMPSTPLECRSHAQRCLERAEHASTALYCKLLVDVAQQWSKLANDLDNVEMFTKLIDQLGDSADPTIKRVSDGKGGNGHEVEPVDSNS